MHNLYASLELMFTKLFYSLYGFNISVILFLMNPLHDCLWAFVFPRNIDDMFLSYIPQKGISVVSLLYKQHFHNVWSLVKVLTVHSCPTLCDPMDCSPPGSSVCGDSPGKNTGVGCRAFLQGIFPAQGSNPGFPHCRQILYRLSHQVRPLLSIPFL